MCLLEIIIIIIIIIITITITIIVIMIGERVEEKKEGEELDNTKFCNVMGI